jgi:hypothetical protein
VEETKKRKSEAADDTRQTKKVSKGVKDWMGRPADMDRLAQGLQKLGEDDLLQIVRMVNENKTADMYVKNDLEGTAAHFPLRSLYLVLMGRGRVLYRFIYAWRPTFTDAVGFYETKSRGLMRARWAFGEREVLTTS